MKYLRPRSKPRLTRHDMRRFWVVFCIVSLFIMLALGGCVSDSFWLALEATDPNTAQGSADEAVAETASAITDPAPQAIISTNNVRANIRSGPGLAFPVIESAAPGAPFQLIGKSKDAAWWQICCLRNADESASEQKKFAWVADVVVSVEGDIESLPVVEPLLPDALEATWALDWACASDRCDRKQCEAIIKMQAKEIANQRWLTVENAVTWDDNCHPNESWTSDVDRYSGKERSGADAEQLLYTYWHGAQPDHQSDMTHDVQTLADGRKFTVACSEPRTVEVNEGDGWTTVHSGYSCHDLQTGILTFLSSTKRWIFTGTHEGRTYQRAYFIDHEALEQRLISTNLALSYLD